MKKVFLRLSVNLMVGSRRIGIGSFRLLFNRTLVSAGQCKPTLNRSRQLYSRCTCLSVEKYDGRSDLSVGAWWQNLSQGGSVRSQHGRTHRLFSAVAEPKEDQKGIVPVPLAQTGEGIADCELLQWYVQEGEDVEEFQPLCDVQSDKASVVITSRFKGRVTRVLHAPGAVIKVGETLLEMYVDGNQDSDKVIEKNSSDTDIRIPALPQSSASVFPLSKETYLQAAPAVRQLAKCYGVDLSAVSGSGKDGRILREDVIEYAVSKEELNEEMRGIGEASRGIAGTVFQPQSDSSGSSSESEGDLESSSREPSLVKTTVELLDGDKIIPVRGFRRVMARTMAAAVGVPHLHYTEDIEMNALVQIRNSLKDAYAEQGLKFTYLPFLIKALSLALLKYPLMNSTVNQDVSEIHVRSSHNIGVGMSTSSGLVVPNIKNVQNLSVSQVYAAYENCIHFLTRNSSLRLLLLRISRELVRLTELAASNTLTSNDITGASITMSNFGSIGGKYGSPVLNVPEVAIVAIGRIQTLPRFDKDGRLFPASIMGVTWGADHRVIDGATVARFCNEWKQMIEKPGILLLNM